MYLRCDCGYFTGDETTTLPDLLKKVEEDGGTVDTSQGIDKAIITCPKCKKSEDVEKVN